jgi:hypothetical protein
LDAEPHSENEAPKGDQNPLPVAEVAPEQKAVEPVQLDITLTIKEELAAEPDQQQTPAEVQIVQQPLLVHVTNDDELSNFERQTILYGKVGISVAFLALVAACVTGYFIFQQFKEMSAQTDLSSSAAKQARIDAKDAAIAITKQLTIAQQQAKAAQTSVVAIQNQTVQQERPWIALSVTPGPDFSFDVDKGGIVFVKFTLTNVGHSLAEFVSVWPALSMNANWNDVETKTCSIPKAPINAKSDYGYLIFPGQTITDSIPAAATPEAVRKAIKNSPFQGDAFHGAVVIDVVVCVDYKSTLDPLHHQTRIVRGLLYRGPITGTLAGAFVPNTRYTNLSLLPHLHGDSAD